MTQQQQGPGTGIARRTTRTQALEALPVGRLTLSLGKAELEALLAENYAPGETPDFSRIGFPPGGGKFYEVPMGDSAAAIPELVVALVHHHVSRAYWEVRKGADGTGNKPPTCTSLDGITGSMYGPCAKCKFNVYGTAVDDQGRSGAGKACKEMRRLYVLMPDEDLPRILSLPPGSIKNWQAFRDNTLMPLGLGLHGAIIKIGLEQTRNATGQDYSMATFKIGARLDDASRDLVLTLCNSVQEAAKRVPVGADDYNVPDAAPPEPAAAPRPATTAARAATTAAGAAAAVVAPALQPAWYTAPYRTPAREVAATVTGAIVGPKYVSTDAQAQHVCRVAVIPIQTEKGDGLLLAAGDEMIDALEQEAGISVDKIPVGTKLRVGVDGVFGYPTESDPKVGRIVSVLSATLPQDLPEEDLPF